MRGLENKVVLVTGAAGGIGSATVARFLKEGSWVAALASAIIISTRS